jgi:hypothetical protein
MCGFLKLFVFLKFSASCAAQPWLCTGFRVPCTAAVPPHGQRWRCMMPRAAWHLHCRAGGRQGTCQDHCDGPGRRTAHGHVGQPWQRCGCSDCTVTRPPAAGGRRCRVRLPPSRGRRCQTLPVLSAPGDQHRRRQCGGTCKLCNGHVKRNLFEATISRKRQNRNIPSKESYGSIVFSMAA